MCTKKRANVVACIATARNSVYRCVMSTSLLNEIDAFLAERKIGDHRFGVLAINNGRLLERLRSGRRIWPETADKVRQFMERERQAISSRKESPPASSSAGDNAGVPVTPPAQGAPAIYSNSPDYLPSGEAGAQRSPAVCAPASVSGGE